MEELDNHLIISFGKKLSDKVVDTNIINESLELLCEYSSFDYGMVYEIDQYKTFHLKERYGLDREYQNSFTIDKIGIEILDTMLKLPIYHLKEDNCLPYEKQFLQIINVHSLVAVSIIDEVNHTLGFVVLASQEDCGITEQQLEIISILLPSLAKYISIRMYQNKISFAQKSLESILDNTGIDIYVNDFYTHDILYVNKSMAKPYGGVENFMGRKCWQVLFPGQIGPCEFCPEKNLTDEEGNPTKIYTWDYQRAFDGSWFRVFSAAFRWIDGRIAHVVSSADITDNKRNEELIQYLANYDSLTKLPNRRMLIEECEERIDHSQSNENGFLLFFDIDGFKTINDNFGHDAGDEFLIKLGEFFSSIPMLKDAIYRNGGDEFVGMLDDGVTEENIRNLAYFIHQRFKEPWELKKGSVFCNVSIGVACYPEDGLTAEIILNKADQAMYQVKKNGGAGIMFGYELK